MRNRRPINQQRLRDEPAAFGLRYSTFRPIVKTINQACALIKAIGWQATLDLGRPGLLTITPSRRTLAHRRRVATELRRRDRRRARAGRAAASEWRGWEIPTLVEADDVAALLAEVERLRVAGRAR